jgi:Amt family ammonium transporter
MALVLGIRKGWPRDQMRPHNVPFTLLGAALLWFGWFGFNAGSALAAGNLAGYAFANTNTATAAALLGWIAVEKLKYGKPTTLGAASGAVAGLVAITPCAGFVSPLGSIAVGVLAGAGCALAVRLKTRLGFDDSLDVVAVHLIGGIIGSLGVGLFATLDTNPLGADGLFYGGGFSLLGKQALAVVCVMTYSFTVSFVLGKAINVFIKNRVSEEQEVEGLDLALHGETAYEFTTLTTGGYATAVPPPAPAPAPASAAAKEGVSA